MPLTSFDVLVLVLWIVAVVRATRLINADEITDPIRVAAVKLTSADSTLVYFLGCAWCVSFWVAIASAWWPLLELRMPLWLWPLTALAASQITGTWASVLPGDDIDIEVED